MNSKSLRRLAADHGSLHALGLPPNYLFPPQSTSNLSICCDDLTSLDVQLVGPQGTAYQEGIFHLHLSMPNDYPNAPPTATFRTKIWHPNVDEKGSVCVDTLKSAWTKDLSLRDVLVTISCLLIEPNPASALNAEAGMLIQDGDWAAFEKRAKMMSKIYASIPANLGDAVREARSRGEDEVGMVKEKKGKAKVGKGKAAVKVKDVRTEEVDVTKQKAMPAHESSSDQELLKTTTKPLDPGTDNLPGLRTTRRGKLAQSDDMDLDSSLGTVVHHDEVAAIDFGQSSAPVPVTPSKAIPSNTAIAPVESLPITFTTPPRSIIASDGTSSALLEDDYPSFHFSWMPGCTSPKGKGKAATRSPETLRREKHELRKMKAAGFDVSRYNRGHFGPRKGLLRL